MLLISVHAELPIFLNRTGEIVTLGARLWGNTTAWEVKK